MATPSLETIRGKVRDQERLTPADGEWLFACPDLHALAELANEVRERRHGEVCWYNVNMHLNPTNVCVYRCAFCSFPPGPRRSASDPERHGGAFFSFPPGDPEDQLQTQSGMAGGAFLSFPSGTQKISFRPS